VIARNEGSRIRQCLESVFEAIGSLSSEVLLVDSGSTDDTVQIARGFAVQILTVDRGAPLHPAASRHVGYKSSRGRLMLFMDGDSTLYKEWIPTAVEAFDEPRLAGFAGARQEILVGKDGQHVRSRDRYADRPGEDISALYLGGPAAYRRTVFDEVGGFNPFMYVQEEQELGARIRAAGYLLKRSKSMMTTHFVACEPESLSGLCRRVVRRYPLGMGQLVRYGLKHHCLSAFHFQDVRRHVLFWMILACGAVTTFIWLMTGMTSFVTVWFLACSIAFALFCWRARGIAKPLYFVLEWLVFGPMAFYGFSMKPRSANEYPLAGQDASD
jgi:cellulose synthase/poly-beta-1,6-N-acetylglucosamine synthase-like glycosyltransferase